MKTGESLTRIIIVSFTRTAVIPVVLSDGGTSLSTLTHSFTVTNTLTIEPTASFDPKHKPTASFIDIDRDFDSEVCCLSLYFIPHFVI